MSYRLPPEWSMGELPQLGQGHVSQLRQGEMQERGDVAACFYVPDADGVKWRQFWVYSDREPRPVRRLGLR